MVWYSHLPSGMSAAYTTLTWSQGAPFSMNMLLPLEVICIEGEKKSWNWSPGENHLCSRNTFQPFCLNRFVFFFNFILHHCHPSLSHLYLGSHGTGEHLLFVLLLLSRAVVETGEPWCNSSSDDVPLGILIKTN